MRWPSDSGPSTSQDLCVHAHVTSHTRIAFTTVFTVEMSQGAAAALTVALVVGFTLMLLGTVGGSAVLQVAGLSPGTPVHGAARRYLAARALAFPASLSLMALEGAFRGARDTKAPLGALTLATVLNCVLDPILIVGFQGGVVGAAVATTAAQYVAVAVLWRRMAVACGDACEAVRADAADAPVTPAAPAPRSLPPLPGLPPPMMRECLIVARKGSWLTLRTFSGSYCLAYSSVAAAALGAASGAAHQVGFQIWMAASLLADAVAVAAQALMASAVAREDAPTAGYLFRRTMRLGAAIGGGTAVVLWLLRARLCSLFTRDAAVLGAAASIWPLLVLTQPLNTLAFAVDGLLFGASDFRFCALMFASASLASVLVMRTLHASLHMGLPAVWLGLGLYMALRALLGSVRILSGTGPWQSVARRR